MQEAQVSRVTSSSPADCDPLEGHGPWCYVVAVNQKLAAVHNTLHTSVGDMKDMLPEKFHVLPHGRQVPTEEQDVWLFSQQLNDDDLLRDIIWDGVVLVLKEKKFRITLQLLDNSILTERFRGSDLVAYVKGVMQLQMPRDSQDVPIGRLGVGTWNGTNRGDQRELPEHVTLRECGVQEDSDIWELQELEGDDEGSECGTKLPSEEL